MKQLMIALLFVGCAPFYATTRVCAQAQTPENLLKLCNRTAGPVSATYTLRDLSGSKPAEIFLAAGACQYVSLSGYIGKVTLGGKELSGSGKSFTSVDITPTPTGVVVTTFSSQCAVPLVKGAGYCLQPQ